MNIFFDVDYTILGLDNSLRPDTKETFQALLDENHKIYIWSGMGERWEVVNKFELNQYVSGVYEKPTHHFHERLEELGVPFEPDFVIDDHPEIIAAFPGVLIRPPSHPLEKDTEMWRVYDEITEFASNATENQGAEAAS